MGEKTEKMPRYYVSTSRTNKTISLIERLENGGEQSIAVWHNCQEYWEYTKLQATSLRDILLTNEEKLTEVLVEIKRLKREVVNVLSKRVF